jgi:hypothetical protein
MGGILGNSIKRGLNRAVSNAVGNAVERKVTQGVNQATDKIVPQQQPDPAQIRQNAQAQASAAQLGGIFASFAGAAQGLANEAAKNMKVCPGCGAPCGAEMKFCNQCGSPLPEMTAAQGAACQACGAQNGVGTKFCSGCGAKLPGAVAEEAAAQARNEAVLARWDALLPQYPRWDQGGEIAIEEYGVENGCPSYGLHVSGQGLAAALARYSQLLKASGFVMAGQYPSEQNLFKRVGGVVYSFSSENAFDGGMGHMSLYFSVREPHGGFDYKKPGPKPKASWKDVLGI